MDDIATQRFLHWTAGQLDGDGAISMAKCSSGKVNMPFITMSKAEKGSPALHRIRDVLGGTIGHQPSKNRRRQHVQQWKVTGSSAAALARKMTPYMKLKKRRAVLLATWESALGRFTVSKDGKNISDLSREDAAAAIGSSVKTITKYLQRGAPYKGWTITKVAGNGKELLAGMRAMDGLPHVETGPLHPAYIAGFFDADAYVGLQGTCVIARLSQKWPAVLLAIQQQYGGSVFQGKSGHFHLSLSGKKARAFLMAIQHDCFEKGDQIKMVLSATPATCHAVEATLKTLRGNQGKRLNAPAL